MSTNQTGTRELEVSVSTISTILHDAIEKFGIKAVRAELIESHRQYESAYLSMWDGETDDSPASIDDLVSLMISAAADCVTSEE